MKVFNRVYQYVNILSLDVVGGSVVSALFFARIFDVSLSHYVLAALALTVWVIYTLDHLRDAVIIPELASTDRHRFHQRHFITILIIVVVVGLIDLVMIWYIPGRLIPVALVLGLFVIAYLVFQRQLKFLKEIFVAFLYTGGILLPSLTIVHWDLLPPHYFFITQFAITALINLLLFSLFDYEQDRTHRQPSFVTRFGVSSTRKGIAALGLFNLLGCVWLWASNPQVVMTFAVMNIMLMVILFFQEHFASNNYYRIMGDAVFLIPIFYLL